MQKSEFKKFVIKGLLFSLPFIIATAVELFVLPVNFSTFRPSEATSVYSNLGKILLPGSFYPDSQITSDEIGELGVHTKYAVKKPTFFQTDQLGYRKQPTAAAAADGISSPIVLLGDSYTAGLGLTQSDTLSEQIQKLTNTDVYPLGFSGMDYYLSGAYPEAKKPKIIILEAIEQTIVYIPLMDGPHPDFVTSLKRKLETFRFNPIVEKIQPASVIFDRFSKFALYHKIKTLVDYYFIPKQVMLANTPEPMLFSYGATINIAPPDSDVDAFVQRLTAVNNVLKQRGIRLIFLPIPQKENIYWQYLPEKIPATLLPDLIPKLNKAGIETADTETLFTQQFAQHHTQLYQPDDEHWSATGAKLTAQLVAQMIKSKPN